MHIPAFLPKTGRGAKAPVETTANAVKSKAQRVERRAMLINQRWKERGDVRGEHRSNVRDAVSDAFKALDSPSHI